MYMPVQIKTLSTPYILYKKKTESNSMHALMHALVRAFLHAFLHASLHAGLNACLLACMHACSRRPAANVLRGPHQ